MKDALAGHDAWLLVANSHGINVWCAAGGGHLTHHDVIAALRSSGVAERVDHRTIVLPQLGATGIERARVAEPPAGSRCGARPGSRTCPASSSAGSRSRSASARCASRRGSGSRWRRCGRCRWRWSRRSCCGWSPAAVAAAAAAAAIVGVGRRAVPGPAPAAGHRTPALADPRRVRRRRRSALGAGLLALTGHAGAGAAHRARDRHRRGRCAVLTGRPRRHDALVSEHAQRDQEPLRDRAGRGPLHRRRRLRPGLSARGPGDGRPAPQGRIARPEQCIRCGACIVQCPSDALQFRFTDGRVAEPATIRSTRMNLLGKRSIEVAPAPAPARRADPPA